MSTTLVKYSTKILLMCVLVCAPLLTRAGFGVSPGLIEELHLVPGTHMEKTLYLVQGDPKLDLPATVAVESADIANWLTFPDGTSFIIPAGVQQYPLRVAFDVPVDAPVGDYTAYIRVTTLPKQDPENQITIALGGRIDVHLVVGTDIVVDWDVPHIDVLDVKEGDDPEVVLTIDNRGNTQAGPERVSFDLYNKYGDVRLGYAETAQVSRVPSFTRKALKVTFPIDIRLAPGEYWGHVRVYGRDGVLVRELKTPFDVTVKTFEEKYGDLIVVGGALLILLLCIALVRSIIKHRRAHKQLMHHQQNNVPPPPMRVS